MIVSAPLSLCESKDGYDVDIYIDVASMELFVDGGRVALKDTDYEEIKDLPFMDYIDEEKSNEENSFGTFEDFREGK